MSVKKSQGMTFIGYFLYLAGMALIVLAFVAPLHPYTRFPLFGYLVEPNILRVFCIITGLACIVAGFATIKRLFVGYIALLLGALTAIVMHLYKGDAMAYLGILVDAGIAAYIASCYKEFVPKRFWSDEDDDEEWDEDED